METPGLQETAQLANVFSSFLGELMRAGIEGTGLLFRGAGGLVKGSYALIMLAKREHEQNRRDPSIFRKGSYSMTDMIKVCSQKNVKMQLMRIRNDSGTIEVFEKFARKNKLAYSIMPDLNVHDEYIEVMYPSTQAVQYKSFMNNINKMQAFSISMDDYINNATPDKQQEMQTMIDNLTEEEKKLLNSSETIDNNEKSIVEVSDIPDTYDQELNISGQQLIKKNEDGIAVVALTDDNNKECCLRVAADAVTPMEYGYRVKLNGTEQVTYTSSVDIALHKDDIARETNSSYVVSVPNTNGETFIAFDKRNCKIAGDEITVSINSAERYLLLNKDYQISGESTGTEVYKGHFDSKLISADTIGRYNANYQKQNRLNVPQPEQPQEDMQQMKDEQKEGQVQTDSIQPQIEEMAESERTLPRIIVEVDRERMTDSDVGVKSVNTSQGTVQINQSSMLDSRDRYGNPRTFMLLNTDDTFTIRDKNAQERRISGSELAAIVRDDRLKAYTLQRQAKQKIISTAKTLDEVRSSAVNMQKRR